MFSEIPINSDLWYVFRKNKLEYVHLRATSHVSKFARLRSWNIKGLEKKAGHESPAFFFQPTQLTSYFRWDPRKWLPGSLRWDGLVGSVGFWVRVLIRDGTPGNHLFPAMGDDDFAKFDQVFWCFRMGDLAEFSCVNDAHWSGKWKG